MWTHFICKYEDIMVIVIVAVVDDEKAEDDDDIYNNMISLSQITYWCESVDQRILNLKSYFHQRRYIYVLYPLNWPASIFT